MNENNKLVLVVEDEQSLLQSYSRFLKMEGYSVLQSENGQKALGQISNRPDLVLLDLAMPVMDGVEFLEKANLSNELPNTKIIVFTNSEDDDRIEKAFELGAHRYLLKAMMTPKELARILSEELN